jgi:hypothetical protein
MWTWSWSRSCTIPVHVHDSDRDHVERNKGGADAVCYTGNMTNADKIIADDERYLAEGRQAKVVEKEEKLATTLSWRFFGGLSVAFFGLGLQAVPWGEPRWYFQFFGAGVTLAACVLFFLEFMRFRPSSGKKKWWANLLAMLIFLALAAGVAAGVLLTEHMQ